MANNKNAKNNKVNSNIIASVFLLVILALLIVLARLGYAKFISSANGTATATVAKIICKLQVESSSDSTSSNYSPEVANPFFDVTVMNYEVIEGNNNITEADIDYTIEVVSNSDGFVLPQYHWEWTDSSGTQHTANNIAGTFTNSVPQSQLYRIIFHNPGNDDILNKSVKFNLKAVQAYNE